MTHFPDLSPYRYGHAEPVPGVLNVGWLSADHAFTTGLIDERLVDALHKLVASPVNLYRGHHYCEFCPAPVLRTEANGRKIIDRLPGSFCNGEIHITATNGIGYAAPALILHYVTAHNYRPPQEFVAAAIAVAARGQPIVRRRHALLLWERLRRMVARQKGSPDPRR